MHTIINPPVGATVLDKSPPLPVRLRAQPGHVRQLAATVLGVVLRLLCETSIVKYLFVTLLHAAGRDAAAVIHWSSATGCV